MKSYCKGFKFLLLQLLGMCRISFFMPDAGCRIFPKMICRIGYPAGYPAPAGLPDIAGYSAGYLTSNSELDLYFSRL